MKLSEMTQGAFYRWLRKRIDAQNFRLMDHGTVIEGIGFMLTELWYKDGKEIKCVKSRCGLGMDAKHRFLNDICTFHREIGYLEA